MDKQYLSGTVKSLDIEQQTLTAYASTGAVDRDGEVIEPEAWRGSIQQYPSVPLMWAHDYRIPPIGKATGFEIDGHGLKFRAEFAKSDFAQEIWGLYQDGFLNSFSVGFIPKEATDGKDGGAHMAASGPRTVNSAELLEVSAVAVPANPQATVARGVLTLAFKSVESFEEQQPEEPEPADDPPSEPITDDGGEDDQVEAAENIEPDTDDELTQAEELMLTSQLYELSSRLLLLEMES